MFSRQKNGKLRNARAASRKRDAVKDGSSHADTSEKKQSLPKPRANLHLSSRYRTVIPETPSPEISVTDGARKRSFSIEYPCTSSEKNSLFDSWSQIEDENKNDQHNTTTVQSRPVSTSAAVEWLYEGQDMLQARTMAFRTLLQAKARKPITVHMKYGLAELEQAYRATLNDATLRFAEGCEKLGFLDETDVTGPVEPGDGDTTTKAPSSEFINPSNNHRSTAPQCDNRIKTLQRSSSSHQSHEPITQSPEPRESPEDDPYIVLVKSYFPEDTSTYIEFIGVLMDFTAELTRSDQAKDHIVRLFEGYPDLLLGFNVFLPPEQRDCVE